MEFYEIVIYNSRNRTCYMNTRLFCKMELNDGILSIESGDSCQDADAALSIASQVSLAGRVALRSLLHDLHQKNVDPTFNKSEVSWRNLSSPTAAMERCLLKENASG
jgi:hypothetical protein